MMSAILNTGCLSPFCGSCSRRYNWYVTRGEGAEKEGADGREQKKLEENCPQLKGEDADLWKRFIQRDFGADAVDKYVPKNPQSWSKVYDVRRSPPPLPPILPVPSAPPA